MHAYANVIVMTIWSACSDTLIKRVQPFPGRQIDTRAETGHGQVTAAILSKKFMGQICANFQALNNSGDRTALRHK